LLLDRAELFKASSDAAFLRAGISLPVAIEASLSSDSSALLALVRSAALSAIAATRRAPEACGRAKGGGEIVEAASKRAEAANTDEDEVEVEAQAEEVVVDEEDEEVEKTLRNCPPICLPPLEIEIRESMSFAALLAERSKSGWT
jgi:hypothetical protein